MTWASFTSFVVFLQYSVIMILNFGLGVGRSSGKSLIPRQRGREFKENTVHRSAANLLV